MPKFVGIWPALITPFTEDNRVNLPVLRDLVAYLGERKVDGLFVGGTTGEGIYSSLADRKLVIETVIREVNGRIPVIAHVGAVASGDAVDLAGFAQDCGVAGISSILPPLYTAMPTLVRYFETVADAAPGLPLLAYLLNPNYDAVALIREIMHISSFEGAKYTGPNMFEMRQIIDLGGGRWSLWSGMDEQCVYAAMMGATGAIGSTLNIMPGVYRKIRDWVHQGDYAAAQDLQVRANKVTQVLFANNFQAALKEALTTLGFPCGQPRLPYLPLTDAQREGLHRGLAETDFDQLVRL